jgi:multicomponent Na+:H+ antiporter subunit G
MSFRDALSFAFIVAGMFFFLAGTLGLLRFPDVYGRLHALTKADNLGLGLTVIGLMVQAGSWLEVLKLLLIWILVLLASATASFLIARTALRSGVPPWRPR